jgi:hypothetical protein
MSTLLISGPQREWLCLQNQYDSYEKHALIIKLVAVILCPTLLFMLNTAPWGILFITLLWLQDGIWKTYQHKIGERLLVLEKAIAKSWEHEAMQFDSSWLASLRGGAALVRQYLGQACKPNVAYPYVLLVMVWAVYHYVS